MRALYITILLLSTTVDLQAQAGELDPTFGDEGLVILDLPYDTAEAHAVTIDAQGRSLLVGYAEQDGEPHILVVRLMPDGSLDQTWGGTGHVIADVADDGDEEDAIFVHANADGTVLVGGHADVGGSRMTVLRFLPDGMLDDAFGNGGYVTAGLGKCQAMALQPDGRIVGLSRPISVERFIRLLPDGTLDPTFGTNGQVDFSPTGNLSGQRSLCILADGRIMASMETGAGIQRSVLVRLLADGSIDTGFGTNGRLVLSFYNANRSFRTTKLRQQPDGKLVLGGYAEGVAMDYRFITARLLLDGTMDPTYAGDGWAVGSGFQNLEPLSTTDLLLAADGSPVIIGRQFHPPGTSQYSYHFAACWFTPEGNTNTTFGGDGGVVTVMTTSGHTMPFAGAFEADGRLLLAGRFRASAFQPMKIAAARYFPGDVSTTVSEDGSIPSELHIHPNPSTDVVRVDLSYVLHAKVRVQLFNATGSLVRSMDIERASDAVGRSITLDLGGLPPGIYHVVVKGPLSERAARVVKL